MQDWLDHSWVNSKRMCRIIQKLGGFLLNYFSTHYFMTDETAFIRSAPLPGLAGILALSSSQKE